MPEVPSGERNIPGGIEGKIALLKGLGDLFQRYGKIIPERALAQLQKLPVEKLQALQAFASNQLEQLRGGQNEIAQKKQAQFVATLSGHDNIT